jgi:hypothetical protein
LPTESTLSITVRQRGSTVLPSRGNVGKGSSLGHENKKKDNGNSLGKFCQDAVAMPYLFIIV